MSMVIKFTPGLTIAELKAHMAREPNVLWNAVMRRKIIDYNPRHVPVIRETVTWIREWHNGRPTTYVQGIIFCRPDHDRPFCSGYFADLIDRQS